MNTVIVIGAGASGIIAALEAAKDNSNKVILLEKQARIGKKLSATGNGRCNLTNINASVNHYHGTNPSFVCDAFASFSSENAIEYFRQLGLLTVIQYGGRVYPLSDSANSVIDVLRFALTKPNIELVTSCNVNSVTYANNTFSVDTSIGNYTADYLIVACGGKAGGKLGGCSDGYDILSSLGHHCTKIYPALVPITVHDDIVRSLKGIRCEAELVLNGQTSRGELQFTDIGISGPAVFDISREASLNGGEVHINFLTGDITSILSDRIQSMPTLEIGSLLSGMLHSRIGLAIIKYCGYKPSDSISTLSRSDIERISLACADFVLKIKGTGSFDAAQITVGGILTSEFYSSSMESKLVPGLFACGEVLDVDADCGGFNLQWCWSSGYLAGRLGK